MRESFDNANNSHLYANSRDNLKIYFDAPGAIVTLADMKPGQTALIKQIDASRQGVVRLMVLGLIEGATVRFEQAAIGGDPLEIIVFGASISVSRKQAVFFEIVPEQICD